ncbi:MerR family transcriptional regulator [Sporosarcina sp. FSL K6-5500]
MLRKKDLHSPVGVPKSTVADWVEDFSVYIPKVKQGSVIYYKSETIDVLKFIKLCREQHYQKPQIMQMLADKGFPITVEEAVEDVRRAMEGDTPRDTLLTVMQTMGQAMTELTGQNERLDGHDKVLKTLSEQQNGQNERMESIEKRADEIEILKQDMEALRQELAATKEELNERNSGSFFGRIFGRK